MPTPKAPHQSRRPRLFAEAAMRTLLAKLHDAVSEPITLECSDELNHLRMCLTAIGEEAAPAPLPASGIYWGKSASVEEELLVDKLRELKAKRPTDRVSGPQLCKLCRINYDNPGKGLLRNLVNRDVLIHDEADGYSLPDAAN